MDISIVYSSVDSIIILFEIEVFNAELIAFYASGIFASTINLYSEYVMAALLGSEIELNYGDVAYRTYVELLIFVNFTLIGRVVSPTCEYLDYLAD
jgi:F0F1-type ATP synthase alpha subunit